MRRQAFPEVTDPHSSHSSLKWARSGRARSTRPPSHHLLDPIKLRNWEHADTSQGLQLLHLHAISGDWSLIPAALMHSVCAGQSGLIEDEHQVSVKQETVGQKSRTTAVHPGDLRWRLDEPCLKTGQVQACAGTGPSANHATSCEAQGVSDTKGDGLFVLSRTQTVDLAMEVNSKSKLEEVVQALTLLVATSSTQACNFQRESAGFRSGKQVDSEEGQATRQAQTQAPDPSSMVVPIALVRDPKSKKDCQWPLSRYQLMMLPPPSPPPNKPLPPPPRQRTRPTREELMDQITEEVGQIRRLCADQKALMVLSLPRAGGDVV
ncbi:hypothetical protein LTR37_021420 [Vermiconidia calcicola]|uniref:Uncharacterized protein n=1 Tax=Vermiconidia calcicola TaxID=1690605 RepID=A0ACC3M8X4_9PEZI|nr:hypothetical protein LTR37_021420 [Vermiconidia calcicola]